MKKKILIISLFLMIVFSVTAYAESKATTDTAIKARAKSSKLEIGQKAELSISTPASGTFEYQWYGSKDNSEVLSIISGATEKTYTTDELSEGVYYYACKYSGRINYPDGFEWVVAQSNTVRVIVGNANVPDVPDNPSSGSSGSSVSSGSSGRKTIKEHQYDLKKGDEASLSIVDVQTDLIDTDLIVAMRVAIETTDYGTEATERFYTVPLSLYKEGTLKFRVPETGAYIARYNYMDYTDIKGHWAEKYINFVSAREIFKGTGNGQFSPDKPVTKGMFATILSRLSGEIQKTNYSDGYYLDAVIWACKNGIAPERNMQLFNENKDITREEMAVMIANYLKYSKMSITTKKSETQFSDIDKVNPKYVEAVCQMQDLGIFGGDEVNRFKPDKTATRAEVATVIERLIRIIID